MTLDLLPFQKTFLKNALDPRYHTVAMSIARGNGKTALAGHLITRSLTPGDELFHAGKEIILLASSFKQARHAYAFARDDLEPIGGYRFNDSANSLNAIHRETRTKLTCIACNGKTGQGIVNCPLIIADEPGSWEVNGGGLMWEAINKARGKPGSSVKLLLIGTRAPALGRWWVDMLDRGTRGGTYVYDIQGDEKAWDDWRTIAAANPLKWKFAESRAQLLEDRDRAREDEGEKASFLSYNLNIPTESVDSVLLKPGYWETALKRPVAPREGDFIVGIDLGSNRAWSAAVAIWESGRVEAIAMTPGIPAIGDQEKRDRVSRGTYQELVQIGRLVVASGRHEPDPSDLVNAVTEIWGEPEVVISDRHKINRLRDVNPGWWIKDRAALWFEQTEDIDMLRQMCSDGPLSVERESLRLLTHSLKVAKIEHNKSGGYRMIKRGANNESRDDVAAALVQAAGEWHRQFDGLPIPERYKSLVVGQFEK